MLLVKPSSEILQITPNALQLIEEAGRTCYKSEDKIGPGTAEIFATMILKQGHESVIEHASVTVRIICDRGVTHEIVRHRLASYSQQSTRYCDYVGGQVEFVIPPWVDVAVGRCEDVNGVAKNHEDFIWLMNMLRAEEDYKGLRNRGWKPEQARSVLPNSLKTEIVMTANLREWRHFFKLRTSPASHPQMREIAIPLLAEFQSQVPILFDNI